MPAKSGIRKRGGTSAALRSGKPSSRSVASKPGKPSSRSVASKPRKSGKRALSSSSARQRVTPDWLHWLATGLIVLFVLGGAWVFLLSPYVYRWRPCFGEKEYGVCLPSGFARYGIDISHHQGNIDWEKLSKASDSREYPLQFVIIKATEGGTFKDPNYDLNIAAARKAGFVCGAYHYYNPATSPSRQAEFFFRNVELLPGDLAPVVDIESVPDSKTDMNRELLAFLSALESHYGIRPVIYTGAKYRKKYLDSPVFENYPFWIAHYYVSQPETEYDWSFWQFSDRARLDGIRGFTDINVFKGSDADFEALRKK